ncbi:MAG: hypothetical protein ILP14_10785 [Oscillospiraceae bacterium]|nr:hypothetical protein [Oscillospiraceae bacterium]
MKKMIALLLAMCLCMTAFSAMAAGADTDRDLYRYKPYNPGQSGTLITPYMWETQFNPLDAISSYNTERYKRLPNIGDNNYATTYEWLIVSTEMQDSIPELTAWFYGNSVNSIGIRNGNLKDATEYFYYSRATSFTLKIYYNGTMDTVMIEIPDRYTTDYQVFLLGKTYENVSRIEFWLTNFNFDPNNTRAGKYLLYMADIQFYNMENTGTGLPGFGEG